MGRNTRGENGRKNELGDNDYYHTWNNSVTIEELHKDLKAHKLKKFDGDTEDY